MEEENKNVETDTIVKVEELQDMNNTPSENVPALETINEIKKEPVVASVNNAPKKKSKLLLILLILLAAVGFAVWYFVLGENGINKEQEEPKQEEKQEDNQEENINEEIELIEAETTEKMDSFLSVVKSGNFILSNIYKGAELTKSDKIYITIHSANFTPVTSDTLPEKHKNNEALETYIDHSCILELTFDEFEKTYNNKFGGKIEYTLEDIKNAGTSPCIGNEDTYDEELRIMFFNKCACGEGISNSNYLIKTFKYTYDNNYYYLYSYVAEEITNLNNKDINGLYKISTNEKVDVDKFEGNEDKFDILKITFDKELHFVSSKLN